MKLQRRIDGVELLRRRTALGTGAGRYGTPPGVWAARIDEWGSCEAGGGVRGGSGVTGGEELRGRRCLLAAAFQAEIRRYAGGARAGSDWETPRRLCGSSVRLEEGSGAAER